MTLHVKRLHHQGFAGRLQVRREVKASRYAFFNTGETRRCCSAGDGGHSVNFSEKTREIASLRRQSIFLQ
ncbi:hypothetical protein ACFVTJ_01000 [Agrobacterium sp. NPDC058088]|uniref:hypothetical protein n=1 Tax=Agrobacterium sp. NPDC058088 TaxID=3346335 RepID=UPI0036D77444